MTESTSTPPVLDSTAIAVWLAGGPGARDVGEILTSSVASTSALSVFELAGAVTADQAAEIAELASIEPFTEADALAAARRPLPHRSLPELATIVLAARLGTRIVTADPSWQDIDGVTVQVIGTEE